MTNPWEKTENFTGMPEVYYSNLLNHFIRFRNDTFVETGTYIGNGLNTAIQAGFTKLYSIEIHNYLYENAVVRFNKEIESGLVELYQGDSSDILPIILNKITSPSTFWIDAHISAQYGTQLAKNCPVIEELTAIKNHSINTHTLLIDDLNCFGQSAHDNIQLQEVIDFIFTINSEYKIEYLNSHMHNNILVAYI